MPEPESMNTQAHWQNVYATKNHEKVSWYSPHLRLSHQLIAQYGKKTSRIIDVGAGASTLVDDLHGDGFSELIVLDIAAPALQLAQERLGSSAKSIEWVVADLGSQSLDLAPVQIWHDRAVFHFMTTTETQSTYLKNLQSTLLPGGAAILSTFSLSGPEKCSGFAVKQYDASSLSETLGPDFDLVFSQESTHTTPFDSSQNFITCVFLRK